MQERRKDDQGYKGSQQLKYPSQISIFHHKRKKLQQDQSIRQQEHYAPRTVQPRAPAMEPEQYFISNL